MKTINKYSHLKVISPQFFCQKVQKKNPAKEVYLGKIAAGKITACIVHKKTPSQVPFSVKFFRIFQHTKIVVVNVKHKYHLESK